MGNRALDAVFRNRVWPPMQVVLPGGRCLFRPLHIGDAHGKNAINSGNFDALSPSWL
jgi:hypothetical protein